MRNAIFLVFVAILAVVFSGCPQTPTTDNEVVDATVQQPVQPGEQTGGFSLRMKLYDDADGTKSVEEVASFFPPEESEEKGDGRDSDWTLADWAPIVDHQVRAIESVSMNFYTDPVRNLDVYPDYQFGFRVNQGMVVGDVSGIRVGNYIVNALFLSGGQQLFSALAEITIESGVRKNLTLDAYLINRFQFRFGVIGLELPDDLPNMTVSADDAIGINFDSGGRIEDSAFGFKVVTVSMAYDIRQPAYLKIFDRYHQMITSIPISFSPLSGVLGMVTIDLENEAGAVDFDVNFHPPIESNVYVKARTMNSGQDWTKYFTLQEAVNAVASPIEVLLGVGEYDGCVVPPYTSVTISGQGADQTKIYDYDTSHGYVIWVSPWAPEPHTDAELVPVKSSVAKGGGQSITLYNLAIVNGPGKPRSWYCDAAVVVETASLLMANCAVQSSNRFLSLNYDTGVSISNSILLSDNFIGMWSSYGSNSIGISRSIIMNCSTILEGLSSTVDLFDSITWNCGGDAIHSAILMKEGVMDVDPLLDTNTWHVDVNGPAWTNNIGIDWRG